MAVLALQLWQSNPPELMVQQQMAHCYTDYTRHAQAWLRRLEIQAPFVHKKSRVRCKIESRLNALYRKHSVCPVQLHLCPDD
jgi:hypothetical protein